MSIIYKNKYAFLLNLHQKRRVKTVNGSYGKTKRGLALLIALVMLFGMVVMNIMQRIHNKREAKIMAESDARIQAARLAAEEY